MDGLYCLIKSAFLDISEYVKLGLSIEDIEDCIDIELKINKHAVSRAIPNFLGYEIKTTYKTDEDVITLMDKIINKLDELAFKKNTENYLNN